MVDTLRRRVHLFTVIEADVTQYEELKGEYAGEKDFQDILDCL